MAYDIDDARVKEAYDWVMSWDYYPPLEEITNFYISQLKPPFSLTQRDYWIGILRAIDALNALLSDV